MKTVALLDKPSPRSFGITPIVTTDDAGTLKVHGLVRDSMHRAKHVTRRDVDDLIHTENAIAMPELELPARMIGDGAVAMWVGDAFTHEAQRLDLEVKALPEHEIRLTGGTVFIGPPTDMFVYLSTWLERAFQRVREEKDGETRRRIAALMRWTLPDHPLTMVASLRSAEDPAKELAFQLRSHPSLVGDRWRLEAEKIWREHEPALAAFKCVVVFTGPKGSQRKAIARELAERAHVGFAQFREALHGSEHVLPAANYDQLMVIGEQRVQQSPLGLATEVLAKHVSAAGGVLVLDGLRHARILEAMRTVGLKQLILVAVVPDEDERRKTLMARGLNPEGVARHSTEMDIPALARGADFRVRETMKQEDLGPLIARLQTA